MMNDLKLYYYGSKILRKETENVTLNDIENINNNLENIKDILYRYRGLAISQNQLGINKNYFVINIKQFEGMEDEIFINPKITVVSDDMMKENEGCISFPEISTKIDRHKNVTLKYNNLDMEEKTIDTHGPLIQRVFQHETDHLKGKLIIDHISGVERKMLKSKLKRIKRLNKR